MKRKLKVLVVDDNVAMAKGLAGLLQPTYEVREAYNGNDALRLARIFRPDLILLDVEMPDRSGLEVCRILRADTSFSDLLIVHVSATRADRDDQLQGLEGGANAYITLPTSNRELLARINGMMRVKEVELALRESEGRYRTLAEAVPHLVWTANAAGECDFLSQQWLDYTGALSTEHFGSAWVAALHPDDQARALALWRQAAEGKASYDLEYRLRGKDGVYRWFKTRAVPFRNEEGAIIQWFGTCTEISEIIEAREALKRNRSELETRVQQRTSELQETVKELEKFSYTIAHDFRAPLRAMNSFSNILLDEYERELSGDAKEYLSRIVRSAKRMDRMLTDLLWYSQLNLSPVAFGQLNTRSIIEEVLEQMTGDIRACNADIKIEDTGSCAMADRALLIAVLRQLVSNALKFTASGPPKITIGSTQSGDQVHLFVRDHGIGIDPAHHERIFGLFEKLNSGEVGTGIGLAIAKKCVQRMNGKLSIQSTLGTGSCFTVELPASNGPGFPSVTSTDILGR